MERVSRRTAIGSVAASTALIGLRSNEAKADSQHLTSSKSRDSVKSMTLEEFRKIEVAGTEELFKPRPGHTFSMCHKEMRDKHGIWIPELVPVFEKLDALQASRRPAQP